MKYKAARTNARVKGQEATLKHWLDILDRERAAAIVACLLNPERQPSREVIAFMRRHCAYPALILDSPAANTRFQVLVSFPCTPPRQGP